MKNKKVCSFLRRFNVVFMASVFLSYSFAPIITFGMGIGTIGEEQKNSPIDTEIQTGKSNEEKIQDFQENQNDISIPFIANFGQTDEKVKFYADFFSGTFFISEEELTYLFVGGGEEKKSGDFNREFEEEKQLEAFSLKEKFLDKEGTSIKYVPVEGTRSDKNVSFFKGDESLWKSSVDVYDYISLGEIWENIEVVAQAKKDNVEKLFHVEPSGDPREILMLLDGASRLSVDEGGELVIETKIGKFSMTKPIAYQFIDGKKVEVEVSYDIRSENRYSFSLGEYDKTKMLTIDPLVGGTYIGGADGDYKLNAQDLTFDSSGNVYLAGYTTSAAYPTTPGVIYPTYAAGDDGFVSILNSDMTSLIASTYIGGSASDRVYNVRVSGGDVIISGLTKSSTFPKTAGAYDTTFGGTGTTYNIFITKLNSTLTAIQASTFFGVGTVAYEYINDMEIDSNGKIFLSGYTSSSAFPTSVGAYDTTFGGSRDIYVSRLNPSLAASPSCLEASTYIGGTSSDYGYEMELDSAGNVVVAGETYSSNFPVTAGAYQTTVGASGGGLTVSKLNNDLTSLTASTFLAGLNLNSYDEIYGMDLDSSGNVFIGGTSYYGYFPTTAESYRETFNATGYEDIFIAKLSSDLTNLSASTYFGGITSEDYGGNISIDSNDKVFITGYLYPYDNEASDIPTTEGAYQTTAPGNDWYTQTVVSRFSSDLTTLEASSLINGDDDEEGVFVRIKPNNDVVIYMETESTNMPLGTGAYSTTVGTGNGYIITLDNDLSAPLGAPDHLKITGSATQTAGETQQITITANDVSGNPQPLYTGDKSITLSGPVVAPDGTVPTCTDKDRNDVAIGTATTVTFSSGVATCNLKLYKAESVSIDIAEGVYSSAANETYDLDIVVSPAAVNANNSIIDVSADPSVMMVEEVVTVTTKDSYKNLLQSGGENVEIFISGINSKSLDVVDNGNGTYSGVYTPTCDLGIDDITGKINGSSIGADADGASDGIYNIATQMKVTITVNDVSGSQVSYGGDNIVLNVSGANEAVPTVVDNRNGTYSGYYTPTNAGIDHVSGTLNGRTIGSDTDGVDDGIFDVEICQAFVSYDNKIKSRNHLALPNKTNFLPKAIGDKIAEISSVIMPTAQAEDSDEIKMPEKVKQGGDVVAELDFEKKDDVNIPFIKNDRIVEDDSVKFFSNLQAGKFYVTEENLNYSISNNRELIGESENLNEDILNKGRLDNKSIKLKNDLGIFFKEYFLNKRGEVVNFSPKGEEETKIKNSFFRGNNKGKWKTDNDSYKQLSLGEIWKGIYVKLFSYRERLEKVFYVSPGSSVGDISLGIEGVDSISLNENGKILLKTKEGSTEFSKPIAYQEMESGERKSVVVSYQIKDNNSYGFKVGSYDESRELVIDPYLGGSYLGGSDEEDASYSFMDQGKKIAKDADGNVFVIGSSTSIDFPLTAGAYDETKTSRNGVVISKFNSDLTELLASTTIEGTNGSSIGDVPETVAIDSSGDVFILTTAFSDDFPLTSGAFDIVDDSEDRNMVVSKFSNDLSELKASTLLQGTAYDEATDLALDGDGNVYVLGRTGAMTEGSGYIQSNFPVALGAYLPEHYKEGLPESDYVNYIQVVVAKLSNNLSSLIASTYIPLSWSYSSLAVTRDGNVVIGGMSLSDPLTPSTGGAYDTNFVAGKAGILLLNSNLTSLISATYLGGAVGLTTAVKGLEEDADGNIIAVGFTRDTGFPTTEGAYDTTFHADAGTSFNLFLSKFNSDLSQLLASTFYGVHYDNLYDVYIDSDSNSNIFITGPWLYGGITSTIGAFEENPNTSIGDEVFLSKFNSDLSSVTASTFIPGQYDERAMGIFVDADDNVYTTGITNSSDFPVTNYPSLSYDAVHDGGFADDDLYIIKLDNYLSNDSNPERTSISVASCVPAGDIFDDGNNPDNPTIPQDNPQTIEEEEETNYIHLTDSKNDKLTFEVKIEKDTKVKSDPINKDEDESTSVKNITLKTEEDEDVKGKFIIDSKEKSTDIISSEENGTCIPLEVVNITTDFSNENIKEAEVTFRLPKGWLNKYDFDNLIFTKGEKEDFSLSDKVLTKNKWAILLSNLVSFSDKEYIYKAEADSLEGWWGIYTCSTLENTNQTNEGGIARENDVIIIPTEGGFEEKERIEEDIDNDGKNEEAIDEDQDTQNGYEIFNDPDDSSELIVTSDGDSDEKDDFFVSVDGSNDPEVYWDADNGIISEVEILDVDEDGHNEYLFDADQDSQNDHYYDLDDKLVKGISIEKNISFRDFIQNLIARFESIFNPMILSSVFLPFLAMLIQTGGVRESLLLLKEGYFRLFGILLWRKKKRYDWGVVYDIKTGEPIRLAAVSVIDKKTGRAKETVTTDKYGSYCFLVTPGNYTLRVSKKGFKTPDKNNSGNWNTFYQNSYMGEDLQFDSPDKIALDLPLEKVQAKGNLSRFYPFFIHVFSFIFWVGLIFDVIICLFYPQLFNFIVLVIYIYVAFLKDIAWSKVKWGLVNDLRGVIQPFAVIKLFHQSNQALVTRTIADEEGRYFLVANKGNYFLQANTVGEQARVGNQRISILKRDSIKERVVV